MYTHRLTSEEKEEVYSGEQLAHAEFRLRRRLRRFLLRRRTAEKLEGLWGLYRRVQRSSAGWRLSAGEAEQFLQAVLRAGAHTAWSARAEEIGGAAPATMALLRVYAKFGDTRRLEAAAHARGGEWTQRQADFVATRATAYARADLPAQAAAILQGASPGGGQDADQQTKSSWISAQEQLVMAWARSRRVDEAWAALGRLQAGGGGAATRAWNAVLHMHAVDVRYRQAAVEAVQARMAAAGAALDAASFNILLHGAVLRGAAARWRHWHARMRGAGHAPDAYTYTSLVAQLGGAGQWAEAAAVGRMRVAPTPATAVAALDVDRRRNNVSGVMAHLRRRVARGAWLAPHEFTQAAAAARADAPAWSAEIALLGAALDAGRVPPSAAVDAVAARLPGPTPRAHAARALLAGLATPESRERTAQALVELAEAVAVISDRDPASACDQAPGYDFVSGPARMSFSASLGAAVRALTLAGSQQHAERLAVAAARAQIDVAAPHTLAALATRALGPDAAALVQQHVRATRFNPPGAVAIAQLAQSARAGQAGAYAEVQRASEAHPAARAFAALLQSDAARGDVMGLEATWRRMLERGVAAGAAGHAARVVCYARAGDLLRTRRAFCDLLDHGHAPSRAAVHAVVRCCVRAGHVALALAVVRHAERHVALPPATYNLVLSRCAPAPPLHAQADALFAAMLRTPDARLTHPPCDAARTVAAHRARLGDLRDYRPPPARAGHQAPLSDDAAARSKRALVAWLTSPAAFPGGAESPAESPADSAADRIADPAPPPPPDATTFIVMLRLYGQNHRWADVVRTWHTLAAFNRRVDALAATWPHAARHRVTPFSRMVGWAALALRQMGRPADAAALWDDAAQRGILSDSARALGMDAMLGRLPTRNDTDPQRH
ncbi:hypothetical protein GGI02_004391 [Coemansia sp. RSA 2322]|nr:hypothetical protein GGI02_004391 [Coemansia sp. RSA 2322]